MLDSPRFRRAAGELADRLGRPEGDVVAEAAAGVCEMSAEHHAVAVRAWSRFGRWLTRAYDLEVDEAGLARLLELDGAHTLVWLPSHRSYLDAWVLPQVLERSGFAPTYAMGGSNLDFWPFGPLARRTGMVFIRRDVRDDPVYRLALREYVAHLLDRRANLGWSIEGGRTRTGKLRPPRYGLLRYVADAVRHHEAEHVMLVPVSIVYDQLHEVSLMTAEARGERKREEGLGWLVRFARQQRRRLGRAYVDFGEPLSLRTRLGELESEPTGGPHAVERVALEVCHRINRVTPTTPTAMVTLALLSADRALTLERVVSALEPTARYVERRGYPIAGGADLRDSGQVRQALDELVGSEVVTRFDGGTEVVWGIRADQHLIAAFYRNTAIHFLVNRAIAELVIKRVTEEEPANLYDAAWAEALRLRELLKFEFFFPSKREFALEMRAETALIDPEWERHVKAEAYARDWQLRSALERARPLVSHLVLRPFLEAYLVVAERLAAHDASEPIEQPGFLQECLGAARQWELERRLASAESVSLELLRTALRLAEHRGLLADPEGDLGTARRQFAQELRDAVRRVGEIAGLARATGDAPA